MNNKTFQFAGGKFLIPLLVVITTGCVELKSPPMKPDAGSVQIAPAWKTAAQSGVVQNHWLASFNDVQLTNLVNEAISNNPDLAVTAAELDKATANAKIAQAALWPSLTANGSAENTGRIKRTSSEKSSDVKANTSSFGASLDLSWEVDIWGELRYQNRSGVATALASAQTYAYARQSLAAQVAKAWFAAEEARLQLNLEDEFVVNYSNTLNIVEVEFHAGSVTEQDVASAKANLASSREAATAATATFNQSVRGLEVLVGRYPAAELKVADDLQAVPPPVPAGLPSDLLRRRADIVAAQFTVAAAFDTTQAAAAARLPQISLTSEFGYSSTQLKDLLDPKNAALALAGNLTAPLFDGGELKAEFTLAQAEQKAALASYHSVILTAFEEVENYLENETILAREEEQLSIATGQYEKARHIAETRYQAGQISLTDVLTIEREELQAKSSLLSLKYNRLANRVNLHLALGGDFAMASN